MFRITGFELRIYVDRFTAEPFDFDVFSVSKKGLVNENRRFRLAKPAKSDAMARKEKRRDEHEEF